MTILLILAGLSATQIKLDAEPVILGTTESVGITLDVDEAPERQAWPLRAAVSIGTLSELRRVQDGVYTTVYVPPKTRFPQVALIALWRETGVDAEIEFLRIPLHGRTTLRVKTARLAEVSAQVGESQFGPVRSNRYGKASIPIVVPPDVSQAKVVVKRRNGKITTKSQPFSVPPYNRLTAAIVPRSITSDENEWARVDVFYDLGGPEVRSDRIKTRASHGKISLLEASRGRYSFRYEPHAKTEADRDKIVITVDGDPVARASVDMLLGTPVASRVVLMLPQEQVPPDGRTLDVSVLVLDSAGQGVPKQSLEVTANGKKLSGGSYGGHGVYTFPWQVPTEFPPGGVVQFKAKAKADLSAVRAEANYQLAAKPLPAHITVEISPSPVPADGRTEASVVVWVRDARGTLLEDARLLSRVDHGVLGELKALGGGRYQATYLPPPDLVADRAEITFYSADDAFQSAVELALRRAPGAVMLGATVGGRLNFDGETMPRVMLESWVPVPTDFGIFSVGLLAGFSMRSDEILDSDLGQASTGDWLIIPIEARAGYDLWANSTLTLTTGVGGTAVFARFSNDELGVSEVKWAAGALGFAALGLAAGPGQIVCDVSYAYADINGEFATLDAGGLGLFVGYRMGF